MDVDLKGSFFSRFILRIELVADLDLYDPLYLSLQKDTVSAKQASQTGQL